MAIKHSQLGASHRYIAHVENHCKLPKAFCIVCCSCSPYSPRASDLPLLLSMKHFSTAHPHRQHNKTLFHTINRRQLFTMVVVSYSHSRAIRAKAVAMCSGLAIHSFLVPYPTVPGKVATNSLPRLLGHNP